MCGRFVASSPVDLLADLFSVHEVRLDEDGPRWNVAPSNLVRTVVEREGLRSLESTRWGLVPHWASTPAEGGSRINARAETVHQLPAFRDAFRRRRCLIPADGFYEWRDRRPYLLRPAAPVALAGLRATWRNAGPPLRTCTVVTTTANRRVAEVHDRMPVVLPQDVWDGWLDSSQNDEGWLRSLLVPAPDDLFELVPVSRAVSDVRNEGVHLVEPVDDYRQDTLPL